MSLIRHQDHILITPLARALASQKKIDITKVSGTGFNGRVLVKDIENFNSSSSAQTKQQLPTSGPIDNIVTAKNEDTIIAVSPMRKAIAKAMVKSWTNVAYTNLVVEVNVTKLWNQRKLITTSQIIEHLGIKMTFLPFIAKATTTALQQFPALNSKYDEQQKAIIQQGKINLGIAIDTPKGLVVPVIKEAAGQSPLHLTLAIKDFATKARAGKLSSGDMNQGTFTITNYGSVGALYGVPVINFPEIAILGTGAIIDKVYGDGDSGFYQGKVMHLTCAADHRWVDGAEVGRFLNKIKQLLENPFLLGVF